MSAGPIAQERASHKPPKVSTPDNARVCGPGQPGRGYCGRKGKPAADWAGVTCSDCHAAHRADGAVS